MSLRTITNTRLFAFVRVPFLLITALTLLSVATVWAQAIVPSEPPDAAAGLATYAERCANCHGPEGQGDGPLAANLPNPPTSFTNPDFRRTAVPAELFEIITHGILDAGMPPFGPASSNPLSEAQRQNLVAALYSLSTPASAIEEGAAVYETMCADCHGAAGDAIAEIDLSNPGYWWNSSNQVIFDRLSQPIPEHDFTLAEAQRWAVVDYSRSLSYRFSDPARLNEPLETVRISGTVTNGTTGEVAGDLAAVLHVFDDTEPVETLTTTVSADGVYQFELNDAPPSYAYVVQVNYNDLAFNSDIAQASQAQPALDLPLTIYETTSDPGVIIIERLHIIPEFTTDGLLVNELYLFSNSDDRVYVGQEEVVLRLDLPDQAVEPDFQRSLGTFENFIPADDLFPLDGGWADPRPVMPGQASRTLLVRYRLPYEDAATLAHTLPYPAAGINLILPDGVTLADAAAWSAGEQQAIEGDSFTSYTRPSLPAGETLTISLRGRPGAGSAAGLGVGQGSQATELLIGGGALLLAIGVAAYFFNNWRTGEEALDIEKATPQNRVKEPDTREALLRAIADLDEAHEAGTIESAEYEAERARLKEQLLAIWEE